MVGGGRSALYLADYTAPPKKLKVGGGQGEGDAAAASTASCLPRVTGSLFLCSPSKTMRGARWRTGSPGAAGWSMSGSVCFPH